MNLRAHNPTQAYVTMLPARGRPAPSYPAFASSSSTTVFRSVGLYIAPSIC